MSAAATGPSTVGKIHLIESDDSEPTIKVKAGHRFEVRSVSIVDAQMNPTSKVAARLCGGSGTCLALVEI
jgi:hypothetical protein